MFVTNIRCWLGRRPGGRGRWVISSVAEAAGGVQSAAHAERTAALRVAEGSAGAVPVVVDCEYVHVSTTAGAGAAMQPGGWAVPPLQRRRLVGAHAGGLAADGVGAGTPRRAGRWPLGGRPAAGQHGGQFASAGPHADPWVEEAAPPRRSAALRTRSVVHSAFGAAEAASLAAARGGPMHNARAGAGQLVRLLGHGTIAPERGVPH